MSDSKKYLVRACPWRNSRIKLRVLEVDSQVDVRTVATHALIYACWVGDTKLVKWILNDMQEIIDINMKLDGLGVIEWTTDIMDWIDSRGYYYDRIDIYRLLIQCYGPKLEANYSNFLRDCIMNNYIDIVSYLVTTYTKHLKVERRTNFIFKRLIKAKEYEAAMTYMRHHSHRVRDHDVFTFAPAAKLLSAELFVALLDVFEPDIIATHANMIIRILCWTDFVPEFALKVTTVLDRWPTIMDPKHIELCLVDCWDCNTKHKHASKEDYLVGQMIVKRYIDAVSDQWLGIAMAICCESLNIELLGTVIDKGLAMIQRNPKHLEHVLLECCAQRDVGTCIFVLKRANVNMYAWVLELWCKAADLEAISVLFEEYGTELRDTVPQLFAQACTWGDMELAQLLNQQARGSILESVYNKALLAVSHRGLTDLILMLLELCPCLQLNAKKLILWRTSSDTIELLNTLFGTAFDPKKGGESMTTYGPDGYRVEYSNRIMDYDPHHDRY